MKIRFWDQDELKEREATPEELAEAQRPLSWHYDNKMLRVQVPVELVQDNILKIELGAVDNLYLSAILTYLKESETINRMIENGMLYAYFDEIFPDHRAILESISIAVESKPA